MVLLFIYFLIILFFNYYYYFIFIILVFLGVVLVALHLISELYIFRVFSV